MQKYAFTHLFKFIFLKYNETDMNSKYILPTNVLYGLQNSVQFFIHEISYEQVVHKHKSARSA